MKIKVLILIFPSFFKSSIFPLYNTYGHFSSKFSQKLLDLELWNLWQFCLFSESVTTSDGYRRGYVNFAHLFFVYLYPRYEVHRRYIVFAFSVNMFVCLSVCLSVNFFFSVKDFSATTWVRILKFGTKLERDELYCVTNKQPHIAYQSFYLFIFLSLQWKFLSQISQLLLEPVFSDLVYTFRKAKCTV